MAPVGPAFGLTEDNADLLWVSADRSSSGGPAFDQARSALSALHPLYLRLLVDWAKLQPTAAHDASLGLMSDGCARSIAPCGAYAGLRAELAAIASQQRRASTEGAPAFRVVLDIFGTPRWAASAPSGCEARDTASFSRRLAPGALVSYSKLIRSLVALGAQEGIALEWWSPWNEPNNATFMSPQRASCEAGAAPLAPSAYAELVRAMHAELAASPGTHHILLGELAAYERDSPHRTSVASFVEQLPSDVVCVSETWAIHAYASRAPAGRTADPVRMLESALDGRGPCGRRARIWVTEAGAGAPHPGQPRSPGAVDEREGCLALADQLQSWQGDPRVDAIMQYTFREDPAFPVGLVSADLSHYFLTYSLWRAYVQAHEQGRQLASPSLHCA